MPKSEAYRRHNLWRALSPILHGVTVEYAFVRRILRPLLWVMDLSQTPKVPVEHDPFFLARRMHRAVWVYDTDYLSIAFANQAACRLWNAENEAALCARDLSRGMSLTVADRLKQFQRDFIELDATFTETWTLHPNGHPVTVDVVYSGFVMPDGRMAMMCEVISDAAKLTETVRTTNALLHTDVKIALFGNDGSILYHNPAAHSTLPGSNCSSSQLFVEPADFRRMLKEVAAKGESKFVTEIYTSSGKQWFDLRTKRCLDPVTGETAYLVTAYDVSELKATTDQARYLAARDQLTGCYNRSIVKSDWIEAGAGQHGPEYAVLYFDINMFKAINDTYGHSAGDDTLRELVKRLRRHTGDKDVLARIGGDEFIIVIKGSVCETDLREKLDNIQSDLAEPFEFSAITLDVGVSIGAAVKSRRNGIDWSEALRQADMAMYCSKRSETGEYVVYNDAIGAAAKERSRLKAEIHHAISIGDFEIYYQPRIDLGTNKVAAAEALLRWKHHEIGEIPPSTFIPICEEMGVMNSIGAIVFDKVSKQLSKWHKQGFDMSVSINVSPKQFQHENFIAVTEKTAQHADFPLSLLELEITETSLVGDGNDVSRRIKRIRELGFTVAIDDFGTGYSNLAHISRFPVSCIKADKSFVAKLPDSGPLLSLIFALAKQIGSTIVAEGVETAEQLAWLKENDCDQVQGFLFSKAVPEADFAEVCNRLEEKAALEISTARPEPFAALPHLLATPSIQK